MSEDDIRYAPEMERMQSSNLKKMGYDDDNEVLWVEFNNGRVYRYKGVPKEIHRIIRNAPSKGSAFHRYIRSKAYQFKRIK